MQSLPITTFNVVLLNPAHVIKFVSDWRQFGGFLSTPVSSTNKTVTAMIQLKYC
jgi:hypothetical protein